MWQLKRFAKINFRRLALVIASGSLAITIIAAPAASGLRLGTRSVKLTNNQASEQSDYLVSLRLADSSSNLGSINFTFCSNSPLLSDACIAPTGFNAGSATLASQSGATGFSIKSSSNNQIIISRPPTQPASNDVAYTFSGIVNPAQDGSYYLRVRTYPTSDASGSTTNEGGLAFAINSLVKIQAEVPPYLTFCVGATISGYDCSGASGDYVDFGELSASQAKVGSEQLLAATNASGGYDIRFLGRTLASGNNVVEPMTSTGPSQPGTSQFGLNLRNNSNPNVGSEPTGRGQGVVLGAGYSQPNQFRFESGETIASSTGATDFKKFTVSYLVNVPPHSPPGVYSTTLTYVALGNF